MLQNAYLMPKIIKYRGLGQDFHRGKSDYVYGRVIVAFSETSGTGQYQQQKTGLDGLQV